MFQKTLQRSILLVVGLTFVIFLVELITPQGVSESILYVTVIIASLWSRDRRIIFSTLFLCTLLAAVGHFLSPPSVEPWKSIINRCFAIAVFWMVGLLGLKRLDIEEDLRLKEMSYRNVLDGLLEGTQIIGFDWRYLFVNKTVASQGHETKETLLGRTMMEVYPGIENTELFAAIKRCMQDRLPCQMENEFAYLDGSKGWFQLSIQPAQEGVFILSIDITSRKQAEEDLLKFNAELEQRVAEGIAELKLTNEQLESELFQREQLAEALVSERDLLQSLMDNIPDTIYFKDTASRFTRINRAQVEVLGVNSPEEAIGKTDMDFQNADLAQGFLEEERRIMETGEPLINRIEFNPTPDGKPRWFSATKIPIKDENGHVTGLVGISREITMFKQAEETIRRQNEMLSQLHQITIDLLGYREIDPLLNALVELSAGFLHAPYAEIMLVEEDELVVCAATPNQQHLMGERLNRSKGMLSWQAFDTRKPAVLNDYSTWQYRRNVYNKLSLHAVADFPILRDEQCIGVLAFGRDKPGYEFDQDQIQFGSLFASLATLIIDNTQLRESLRQQSIRDPLTGLFNRRYMEETLKREIQRTTRQLHSLGIIMIDIDHFKRFNDSFGHAAGDSLLHEVGGFLQRYIRGGDVACRYGGEEFILIMPDASLETVQQRAELLHSGIKELHIKEVDRAYGKVTLSFGVAVYPQHGNTIDGVIHAADAALYQAKQGGRDRVVVAK